MNLVPANYTATEPTVPTSASPSTHAHHSATNAQVRQTIGTRSSWSVKSSSSIGSSGSGGLNQNNNNHSYLQQQQFTVSKTASTAGEQSKYTLGKTFCDETKVTGGADPIQGGSKCGARTPFTNLPVYLNNSFNTNWNCSLDAQPVRARVRNQHMNFIKNDADCDDDKRKVMELLIIHLVEQSALAWEGGKPELALVRAKEAVGEFNTLKAAMVQDKSGNGSMNQQASFTTNQGKASGSIKMMMTRGVSLFELSIMVESNLAAQMKNNGQLEEAIELYIQLCRLAGAADGGGGHSSQVASMLSSHHNSHSRDAKFLLYRFGIDIGNLYHELGEYQRALKYYRLTLDRFASTGNHYQNLKIKLMNNISITLLAAEQSSDSAVSSLNLLLADNLSQLPQQLGATSESPLIDVFNSNHHSFGLNLMLCHYMRADLKSMMVTFENLVKVNICHQYSQQAASGSSALIGRNKQHAASQRSIRDDSLAMGATKHTNEPMDRQLNESVMNRGGNDSSSAGSISRASSRLSDATTVTGQQRDGLTMNSGSIFRLDQNNRLESLINEKHKQISRCFTVSCNLMMDLDRRTGQYADISLTKDSDQMYPSLFDYCIKILENNPIYKSIVCDLKGNSVLNLVERRNELDDAIKVLADIAADHSPKIDQGTTHKGSVKSVLSQSSVVSAYSSLFHLLKRNLELAKDYGNSALKLDKSNAQTMINLGSCHLLMGDFIKAENLYREALMLEPFSWVANYNLALVHRKLGRNLDDLAPTIKSSLNLEHHNLSAVVNERLILPILQLALMSQSSASSQQYLAISESILTNSKMSPEVRFFAAKLTDLSKKSNLAALLQMSGDYPYFVPLAERLIALNIQNFEYPTASKLLISCIINRPDQVKWFQILAECHIRAAEYNSAISTYKLAIDLFPQDTTCLRALVKLCDELGLSGEKQAHETKLKKLLCI